VTEIDIGDFHIDIGGFKAHDYFGDGSFYLLHVPGVGNLPSSIVEISTSLLSIRPHTSLVWLESLPQLSYFLEQTLVITRGCFDPTPISTSIFLALDTLPPIRYLIISLKKESLQK
jgi:hypothetical protein